MSFSFSRSHLSSIVNCDLAFLILSLSLFIRLMLHLGMESSGLVGYCIMRKQGCRIRNTLSILASREHGIRKKTQSKEMFILVHGFRKF